VLITILLLIPFVKGEEEIILGINTSETYICEDYGETIGISEYQLIPGDYPTYTTIDSISETDTQVYTFSCSCRNLNPFDIVNSLSTDVNDESWFGTMSYTYYDSYNGWFWHAEEVIYAALFEETSSDGDPTFYYMSKDETDMQSTQLLILPTLLAGVTGADLGMIAVNIEDNYATGNTEVDFVPVCELELSILSKQESDYCFDEADNDEDGFIDCADNECDEIGYCEYEIELSCADGFDNDEDGSKDCKDSDCNNLQCGFYNGSTCVNSICTELICYDGIDKDLRYASETEYVSYTEDSITGSMVSNDLITGAFTLNETLVNVTIEGVIIVNTNYTDDGTDCGDTDCDGEACDENSICYDGVCTEIEYYAPTVTLDIEEEIYYFTTYKEVLNYLNLGEVYKSSDYPELSDTNNGICEDFCNEKGKHCGFADKGMNICQEEGSTTCTCY